MATTYILESGEPYIRKRTEKGWTLDFVFNRDGIDWSGGTTFYYWGISGETEQKNYVDNNLSFSFTDDGRVLWEAIHYKLDNNNTPIYYTATGQTSVLCLGGTSNDFNLSIVFERYRELDGCDLPNYGGINDLITDKITTIDQLDWLTGATENSTLVEGLNQKWYENRSARLGVLKIYLNGQKVYTLENFEEVIPTTRQIETVSFNADGSQSIFDVGEDIGILVSVLVDNKIKKQAIEFTHDENTSSIEFIESIIPVSGSTITIIYFKTYLNPLVQVFGGGTLESGEIHEGETEFDLLQYNYYEYPFTHLQIKDNYNTNIKPNFSITECGDDCADNLYNNLFTPTPTPTSTPTPTPTTTPTSTPTSTSTPLPTSSPTPTPTSTPTPTPTPTPDIVQLTVRLGEGQFIKFDNLQRFTDIVTGVTRNVSYGVTGTTQNGQSFVRWDYSGMTISNSTSNPTTITVTGNTAEIIPIYALHTPTPTPAPTSTPTPTPTPYPFSTPPPSGFTFDADYIVVTYAFTDGTDLDTRTRISNPDIGQNDLSTYLGWSRSNEFPVDSETPILKWAGDNTGTGFESVLIDLIQLKSQFPQFSGSTITVDMNAMWYGDLGSNPVIMDIMMYKGGTMTLDEDAYLFVNNTYSGIYGVASTGTIVTLQSQEENDQELVATLQYNLSTYIGNFI
jgi:hypothetical protein